jgi:hypothetical protein
VTDRDRTSRKRTRTVNRRRRHATITHAFTSRRVGKGRTVADPFPGPERRESHCPRAAEMDRKLLSAKTSSAQTLYVVLYRRVSARPSRPRRPPATTVWRVAYCARGRKRQPRLPVSRRHDLVRARARHTPGRTGPPAPDTATSAPHRRPSRRLPFLSRPADSRLSVGVRIRYILNIYNIHDITLLYTLSSCRYRVSSPWYYIYMYMYILWWRSSSS